MALSEKKKASNAKWDTKNLKRLSLAMLVDDYERMEKHIAQTKETRNGFINYAIKKTIDDAEAEKK